MKKLTKKEAIRITIELWEWCVNNPGKGKDKWPGWEEYGDMYLTCPFCEYGDQMRRKHNKPGLCTYCPYDEMFGPCMSGPYSFSNYGEVLEYSKAFLAQLRELK